MKHSAKENEIRAREDRLKKDEDGIAFGQDALRWTKSNDWPSVLKNCGARRGYRGLFKLGR